MNGGNKGQQPEIVQVMPGWRYLRMQTKGVFGGSGGQSKFKQGTAHVPRSFKLFVCDRLGKYVTKQSC
jgi:hypothetical protein